MCNETGFPVRWMLLISECLFSSCNYLALAVLKINLMVCVLLDNMGAASMQREGSLGEGSMDSYQRKALVSAASKVCVGQGQGQLEGSHIPQHHSQCMHTYTCTHTNKHTPVHQRDSKH